MSKTDWSWVDKKYPRKVKVLIEFEKEGDFCDLDMIRGHGLGEALLNIVGEDYNLTDSVTLKIPDTDRSVRITRITKRKGSEDR
jgi:hypothetical protein